jgi:DNA-binding transcriptional MerR regulator
LHGLPLSHAARAANVSADTVRYYERVGLIAPPERATPGYRAYCEHDLHRLSQLLERLLASDIGEDAISAASSSHTD